MWLVSSAMVFGLLGDLVKCVANFVPWFPYLCSSNSFTCSAIPVRIGAHCPAAPQPAQCSQHLDVLSPAGIFFAQQLLKKMYLELRFLIFFFKTNDVDVSQFANWLDNSHFLFLVKVWIFNLGANMHKQTPIRISKLSLYFQTVPEAFFICFQFPTHLLTPVHEFTFI